MYEKPQYLTSKGLRRTSKNPSKSPQKQHVPFNSDTNLKAFVERHKKLLNLSSPSQRTHSVQPTKSSGILRSRNISNRKKLPKISDQAAMLIAMAIKDMLRS